MAGLTRVVMHPQKMAEMLRGPNGPVMRRMIEDGEPVKREAMRLAPVHQPVPGERRQRRPGTLRDSIVKRVNPKGWVEVGSHDKVAMWTNKGTRPHVIMGRPLLVFYWSKVGRVVAFPRVNHPGTKGTNWLPKALDVLRRRY